MYKTIKISAGEGGWGGPLTITPTEKCHTVLSVTGGGIHPVAAKIAELTGGEAVDGWRTTLPDDEIMVAVVDCGGTVRCGVYPKKGINTVNLMPVGKAGPLANFITEDNYVSAVREKNIEAIDDDLLTENIVVRGGKIMYKKVKISHGDGGWGGPLIITPTEKCHTVLSVTGGGIHPVAAKIAELTGGEAVDGWKTTLPDDEIMVAVVDCGGTARCGVYPKKGINTVNLMPAGKAGPLAMFITEDIYVSAVREKNIEVIDDAPTETAATAAAAPAATAAAVEKGPKTKAQPQQLLWKRDLRQRLRLRLKSQQLMKERSRAS